MSAGDGAAGKKGLCHNCHRPVVVPARSTWPRGGGPSLLRLGLVIVLALLILAVVLWFWLSP
jgi:hypothetical protein